MRMCRRRSGRWSGPSSCPWRMSLRSRGGARWRRGGGGAGGGMWGVRGGAGAVGRSFLMPVEDVFTMSGGGTVATGRVERGVVNVGDAVEIVGYRATQQTVATGVEMFRKILDRGEAGDNIGVLLRGVKRDEIERGQVLAKPGSITPHTRFAVEVYVLSKDEGGRHTPFFQGYRPQFYFRTTDVTGVGTLVAVGR